MAVSNDKDETRNETLWAPSRFELCNIISCQTKGLGSDGVLGASPQPHAPRHWSLLTA